MAGVLQLPMSHFGRFRGSNSEIWQQEDFWNIAMPKDPCCLFLQCTSPNKTGEYSRASLAKGIDVFLRSLVIASQGNMHPIAVSELLASPVKYVTYILSLLIHDETSFVSSSELVPEDETGERALIYSSWNTLD